MRYGSALACVAESLSRRARGSLGRLFSSRDAGGGDIYITELSETELAQHVELAPNGAWRKLTRRWRRSLERDPTSARILNNLGVAYEQRGLRELASECYRRALDLAPENVYIRRNYELFSRANEKNTR